MQTYWHTCIYGMHCLVPHPTNKGSWVRFKEVEAEIKRLQAELDDTGYTLQIHQISGDYEAGRRLGEKAATEKVKEQRVEIEQLNTALRIVADRINTLESDRAALAKHIGMNEAVEIILAAKAAGENN